MKALRLKPLVLAVRQAGVFAAYPPIMGSAQFYWDVGVIGTRR